jgi:hypothetical protein
MYAYGIYVPLKYSGDTFVQSCIIADLCKELGKRYLMCENCLFITLDCNNSTNMWNLCSNCKNGGSITEEEMRSFAWTTCKILGARPRRCVNCKAVGPARKTLWTKCKVNMEWICRECCFDIDTSTDNTENVMCRKCYKK